MPITQSTAQDSAGEILVGKQDLTPSAPATATVTTTASTIVSANANRKGLIVQNLSNVRVSLGLSATAVLNSGITLYPGGTLIMDPFCFDTGLVSAIAAAAGSVVSIQEFS